MPLGCVFLTVPGLDGAQDHLDVAAAPEQQGRRAGIALQGVARAGIFQVAEGEPRAAQQEHLDQPVEGDGDLAEEEGAPQLRRDEDVIHHQQGDRQDGRGPEDVEEIRQGREAPLGPVEVGEPVDHAGEGDEGRQEQRQVSEALLQERPFEAHEERRHDGDTRHSEIVDNDKRFLETLPIHNFAMPYQGVSVGLMSLSM